MKTTPEALEVLRKASNDLRPSKLARRPITP